MPEVVESTMSEDGRSSDVSSGSVSRLKKLTSGKSWVSPFRDSSNKSKNLRKQLKEENSIEQIHVPSKFALHPTLEQQKRKEQEKKKAEKLASTTASTKSLKDEPIDTPKADSDVEPVEDGEEETKSDAEADTKAVTLKEDPTDAEETAAAEAVDDDKEKEDDEDKIEEESKAPVDEADGEDAAATSGEIEAKEAAAAPIDLVVQPESKYEPVQLPSQKHLEKLQDKPVLLNRYQLLNADAIGSVSKTLDDPNKVVDLGSGLKMTQQQLLDIAAKRVAPVLTNINNEVSKTLKEDEIKHQQELDNKTSTHNKKLQGEFEDLSRMMKNAEIAAFNFKTQNTKDIETANDEYKDREEKAVTKHETDKETLLKNHDELEATKKQELEDAKTKQEEATKEIEELQEKKTVLDNKNLELSDEIEKLTSELNEKEAELADLKSKHEEKTAIVEKNRSTKEELDQKIAASKTSLESKKAKHAALVATVAGLGATLLVQAY